MSKTLRPEKLQTAYKIIAKLNDELIMYKQIIEELRSRFGEDIDAALEEIYEDMAEDY